MIGREIAHFRILSELGRGGMGRVFLAEDTKLERRVALKFLGPELEHDPRARQRFLREARAAAALDHPFICSIFEIGESEGDAYIAMEHVAGEALSDRLARGPLPAPEALRLGAEIAEALACAHERGIVHRDLKPGNVMLTTGGHVKVMDFGLAKRIGGAEGAGADDETRSATLTRPGVAAGTLAYMSPEQLRGAELDGRSDLFSLGIVLHEMLTGAHPFRRGSAIETASAILSAPPPALDEGDPRTSGPLASLVERLLAKEREARFPTARAAAAALGDALAGGGARAPARAPARRVRVRRGAPFVAAALLGLVAIVAALRWAPWDGSEEGPSAPPAPTLETAYDFHREGMARLARFDRPGAIDAASAAFQRALELDPDHAAANAGLAEAFRRRFGDGQDPALLEQAIRHARRAVELDPHLAVARIALGFALLDARRAEEARPELEQALVADPSNARARLGTALLAETEGRFDDAERAFAETLRLGPNDWEAHVLRGAFLFGRGRYADAERSFAKAVELTPDNSIGYFNLAAAQQMQDRNADAAGNYQRALEIQPSAAAYSNLATLYFFEGLYARAASAYEKAVELDANNFLLWANLGDAYRWAPDGARKAADAYAVAIRGLSDQLASTPDDRLLASRLALLEAKAGRADDALARLDGLAPTEGPDDPNLRYRTALAYEIAGRRDRALEELERALDAGYPLSVARSDPELAGLRADPRFQLLVVRRGSAGSGG